MKIIRCKIKLIVSWLIVVLYLTLIFAFSSQSGTQSNGISKGIVQAVVKYTVQTNTMHKSSALNRANLNRILRKSAHFAEYFILSMLLFGALSKLDKKTGMVILITFTFCLLYAASDEIHQIFVPERSPKVTDVIIDTCGTATALVLMYWLNISRKKTKRLSEKPAG